MLDLSKTLVLAAICGLIETSLAHQEESSSMSDHAYDDMEKEMLRHSMRRRERQYEGLPIEFDYRKHGGDGASQPLINSHQESKDTTKGKRNNIPPTTTTTTTTTTTIAAPLNPPLDRRYRRIYNPDEEASVKDYPFMAALLVNRQLWCGAAVIDSDTVMTAAHCLQLQYNNRFFREYMKMLTVRVGSDNATDGGDLLYVTEIFFHPNYKPQSLEFNFAVLKLHKNITAKKEIKVEKIALSRERIVPVDKVTFLGWGSVLGVGGSGGSVLLQKLDLPIYDLADCQEIYGRSLVTRNNFCAGYITMKKNVCNHDAGGPAVMDGQLVGILSFSSKRCDTTDQPAVFSTVGVAVPWIEKLGETNLQVRNTVLATLNH